MKLASFIIINKYVLTNVFMFLLLIIVCKSNVAADALTYSPDQWPRHWNVLINKTQLNRRQEQNVQYQQNGYSSKKPARSPEWGVTPVVKQKSRRSVRPEYNTNAHMRNYYSGLSGYGLANPYISPRLVPGVMPGLAAPSIPFITNPYVNNPFMGGMPAPGYRW